MNLRRRKAVKSCAVSSGPALDVRFLGQPQRPGPELAPGGLGDEYLTAAPAAWAQFSTPHSASLAPRCDPPRPTHRHWRPALRTVANGGKGDHPELAGLVRRKKPLAALWHVSSRWSSAGGAVELRQCVRSGHGPIVARRNPGQITVPRTGGGCESPRPGTASLGLLGAARTSLTGA
jgi:hypothetical protein